MAYEATHPIEAPEPTRELEGGGHRRNEARSLALHEVVAAKLRSDPALLERARARVETWERAGSVASPYRQAWREVLAQRLDEVCAFLVDPGERARMLRQVSPFAGAIPPRERWAILRASAACPPAGHDA